MNPQQDTLDKLFTGDVKVHFTNTLTGNEFYYTIKQDKENSDLFMVFSHTNGQYIVGKIYFSYNAFTPTLKKPELTIWKWGKPTDVFQAVWTRLTGKQPLEPFIKITIEENAKADSALPK